MTCTTFVLGGVAAWAPYYIFEREARFEITPKALDDLGNEKTSDGTPVVPPDVVDKLRPLLGEASLNESGTQGQAGRELVDGRRPESVPVEQVFDAATAPDSTTPRDGRDDLRRDRRRLRAGRDAVRRVARGLAAGPRVRGAYFLAAGWTDADRVPVVRGHAVRPVPLRLGVRVRGRLLPVLQHRAGEHHPGERHPVTASGRRRSPSTSWSFTLLGDAITPPLIGLVADLSDLGTALLWCRS